MVRAVVRGRRSPRISEMSATLSPISNLRLCSLRTEVAALSEVVLGIL